MDHKSKILISLVFLIAVFSVCSLFYKTVILQDFELVGFEEESITIE